MALKCTPWYDEPLAIIDLVGDELAYAILLQRHEQRYR